MKKKILNKFFLNPKFKFEKKKNFKTKAKFFFEQKNPKYRIEKNLKILSRKTDYGLSVCFFFFNPKAKFLI